MIGVTVGNKGLDINFGIGTTNFGGHRQAGAAVVIQIKVGLGNADKVDIAVQAAVEGEVRHLGIYSLVGSIVDGDDNQVVWLQCSGDIDTPGGVAAVVMGELLTIYINIGGGVGAADL